MSTVNANPLRETLVVPPETAQARPSMFSTLRVFNNSQYDILRASIDGHSLLNPTMLLGPSPTIPPGASRNFYVTPSGITRAGVELSAGLSWGTEMVGTYWNWIDLTAGLTTVITFPRITLGQMFNRDRPLAFFGAWVPVRPGNAVYQEVIYTFDQFGGWSARVDGQQGVTHEYGSLLEVSWPDFATNVLFKLRTMDFPISIHPYCAITSFFMVVGGTYVLFTHRRSGW